MDPLTHTLCGAALARSGLGERTPLATATLLIAVNLPDVDAVTYFMSPDVGLEWRRGWTHGILAFVLLPLVLTAAMMAYDRVWRRRRGGAPVVAGQLLLLSYLGFATHPFLDWLNTYGIRLLMPFDGRWFYGDALFIIDPWLWLVLGGGAFLSYSRSRRAMVSWGVLAAFISLIVLLGMPSLTARVLWLAGLALLAVLRATLSPSDRLGRGLARGALALTGLYVAAILATSVLAERDIRAQLPDLGVDTVEDLMVGPLPGNPFLRDVIVVTPDGYRFGTYNWLSRSRLRLGDGTLPRPEGSAVAAAAFAAPCVRGMVGWLRYPFVEVEEREGGYDVDVKDARYARDQHGGFGTSRVPLNRDLSDACERP